MERFDLIVIGSGAGLMVIEAALTQGLKCALVEKAKVGGTCLTKGCIPSKMLVYPADLVREAQRADRVGISYAPPKIDWDTIASRMWKEVNISKSLETQLSQVSDLTLFRGQAEFTGPDQLRIQYDDDTDPDEISADKILIAAGARTRVPDVPGLSETGYVTAESFFGDRFPEKPYDRLAIIGGGPIGAEFAHIFATMGTEVTIVERQARLLAVEEEEVSQFVEKQFSAYGISCHTDSTIVEAAREGAQKTIILDHQGIRQSITCDEIFIATGTRSNADLLKLENTTVDLDERGWIKTNEYLETSQPGIWALGDINGKYQFRHKANFEAEVLIKNLFGADESRRSVTYNSVPWAVYTDPQVAHVGMTEQQARAMGLEVHIARNHYSDVVGGIARGYSKHDPDNGFVKILVDHDRKIIGAHVVGPHAAILLQPFVYLMNTGQKCPDKKILSADSDHSTIQSLRIMCPSLGSYMPINNSMVIHPSLNELTAWAFENIDWSEE